MISQEKKELVIQLFKEGNRPYHIHKQTLISNTQVRKIIFEYKRKQSEFFDVNEYECWICPLKTN